MEHFNALNLLNSLNSYALMEAYLVLTAQLEGSLASQQQIHGFDAVLNSWGLILKILW